MKLLKFLFIVALLGMTASPLQSGQAPPNLQAALILKLLPFYKNLKDSVTIHVIGDDAIANELKKHVGKTLGKAKLEAVTSGSGLPSGAADVVYIGTNIAEGIQYTQSNKVLSITGNPDLIEKGVTLGIGLDGKKPAIFLNLNSSKAEGAEWNPAILKVAKTVG